MTELNPCPFCGGENAFIFESVGSRSSFYEEEWQYEVHCECGARARGPWRDTPKEAKKAAIETWNDRWERTCHDDGTIVFRCDECGAFVKRGAVMDCCTTIPIRHCPNCGAKVVER